MGNITSNYHNNQIYECNECNETFKLAHQYYIHCYKEHEIPIPKLDSELGIIEEIDDILLSNYQQ